MTEPPPPPRIHFILAREAPVAVVFRRGPSKQVAVLKLTGGGRARLLRSDEGPAEVSPAPGSDPVICLPRLRRDGRRETSRSMDKTERAIVLEKPVRKNRTLEKSFRERLSADAVLFSRDGALWRQRVHAKGPEDPKLVADLSGMKFETRKAPHAGVRKVRHG